MSGSKVIIISNSNEIYSRPCRFEAIKYPVSNILKARPTTPTSQSLVNDHDNPVNQPILQAIISTYPIIDLDKESCSNPCQMTNKNQTSKEDNAHRARL